MPDFRDIAGEEALLKKALEPSGRLLGVHRCTNRSYSRGFFIFFRVGVVEATLLNLGLLLPIHTIQSVSNFQKYSYKYLVLLAIVPESTSEAAGEKQYLLLCLCYIFQTFQEKCLLATVLRAQIRRVYRKNGYLPSNSSHNSRSNQEKHF